MKREYPFCICWSKKVLLPIFFLLYQLPCGAQLPEYLELYDPKIQGQCIASGGIVWNKITQQIIFSGRFKTSLTSGSIFYSDGINTFIRSNIDGHFITQLPGKDYRYNSFSRMLWTYLNNRFTSYTEIGQPVIELTFSGNNIYPYQHEVRYTRNNLVYTYGFANSNEQLVGTFEGTFAKWFLDGGYFLTRQGSVIRLYDKNATIVKLIDMPSAENLGGSGNYFWTYPSTGSATEPLLLYRVNETNVYSYPTGTSGKTFATAKNIAILKFGYDAFSIIELSDSQPHVTTHQGAGPFLESYDSDMNGNWISGNSSGVVNYGDLTNAPITLNLGRIRSMSGDENNNLVITASSGHVLLYKLGASVINPIDTFKIHSSKAELSLDGKYLAASGNTFDAPYSDHELSLYLYDVTDKSLVKKWYYNFAYDNSPYPRDFDFSDDGKFISQKTSTWNGSTWSYFNFLSSVSSADSTFLNYDDNKTAPQLSSTGTYAITSLASPHLSDNPDISKLYSASGTLLNAFTGFVPEWISSTRFVFNRQDSIKCRKSICTNYYSPHIYSTDGQEDKTYLLPDSINDGMRRIKTGALDPVTRISDHELYVNNSNVIDIKTGKVLFAFDTIPSLSTPVGPDCIVYLKDNKLQIINWRSLSQQVWNKDSDGDGFGDPSVMQAFYKRPNGFVDNNQDCNDSDVSINPDTKWYKDQDEDGFGAPELFQTGCTQPPGYVQSNTDCDDTDKSLTPLNACVITAIGEPVPDINVFPNPGSGIYYVRYENSVSEIRIITCYGQEINPQITKDGKFYVINLTSEKDGLYILTMQADNRNLNIKIIKH